LHVPSWSDEDFGEVETFILSTLHSLRMAMNIKSPEVEKLVEALAAMTGESKTETVRRALAERRERLSLQRAHRERGQDFLRYLEEEVWPKVPPAQLGRRLSRDEEDQILGYGPGGV